MTAETMIRTQIQLEPTQYERLKSLAARRAISIAQIVREGVDHMLASEHDDTAWERLLAAAGSCQPEGAETDVSARHDDYLRDVYG